MATDSATALRTFGELRGVPAISGFSRPKSHLGRFSFRYTHLDTSSFLSSNSLRLPTHLTGSAPFLPSLDAVFLVRDKHGSRPNRISGAPEEPGQYLREGRPSSRLCRWDQPGSLLRNPGPRAGRE